MWKNFLKSVSRVFVTAILAEAQAEANASVDNLTKATTAERDLMKQGIALIVIRVNSKLI